MRWPLLGAMALFGACTTSQSPRDDDALVFDRVQARVFWIPAVWFEADEDAGVPAVDADLDVGAGAGVRIGVHDETRGVGLMVVGARHDDERTGADVDTGAAYLDFTARRAIHRQGPVATYLGAAASVGAAWVRFEDPRIEDEVTAAGQLRGELEVEVGAYTAFAVGFTGFLWGHPGETLGGGSYLWLGGQLRF